MNTAYTTPYRAGSLRALLHPRGQGPLFAAALGAGLLLGWVGMTRLRLPLWGAAALLLALPGSAEVARRPPAPRHARHGARRPARHAEPAYH